MILTAWIGWLGAFAVGGAGEAKQEARVTSFIPKDKMGAFLAAHLDLTTFRNSFGPRRHPGQRHFADFGLKPTQIREREVEFELEDWFYSVAVTERADVNSDGVEDLVIRFTDQAVKGTYATSEKLLVTRYSEKSPLIALAYQP